MADFQESSQVAGGQEVRSVPEMANTKAPSRVARQAYLPVFDAPRSRGSHERREVLQCVGWNQRDDKATSKISGTIKGEWGDWRAAEKHNGDDLVVRVPTRVWEPEPE